MKLLIGENIRNYRKKNDLTQDQLADRLGVTYQSISRWENGTTYPDIELLPAISEVLGVTVDELIGMPVAEKEKRAEEACLELRRECIKQNYDAEKIVSLLRDIRRNYLGTDSIWHPWVSGNFRAFRDPKILPELRLFADAYLARHPMAPHTIKTMAEVEDEEHLTEFLQKYTTAFDCSERALKFSRYYGRGDAEKFEPERRFQLYHALNNLLSPRYLVKMGAGSKENEEADEFMEQVLSLVRRDAADNSTDMWINDRLELGIKSAAGFAKQGNKEEAFLKLSEVVTLLESTMKIKDEIKLPTSCRFLEGMDVIAHEDWYDRDNNPDSPEERVICIFTKMNGLVACNLIFPSNYIDMLCGKDFDILRPSPEFDTIIKRIQKLVETRDKE